MTSSKETRLMSKTEYLDWTQFSDPESAIELLRNSVRKSIDYDAFGDQKIWQAMALTPAKRINNFEAAGLNIPFSKATQSPMQSPVYVFKARILGEKSPHLCIPDPCNLAYNSDRRFVEALIELHITVVFIKTGTADPPGEGDIVLIELKNNELSYDLQSATFVSSIARNTSEESFIGNKGCSMTYDVFDNMDLYVDAPIPTGGPMVDIVPVGPEVIVSQDMVHFIGNLRKLISKDQINLIQITSGVRTPEKQAGAISAKRAIHKCESGISSAPSSGDPCYPIYRLYAQKELIMEALRVPNSVTEMTKVFNRQISNKKYLSRHMRGKGMDLRVHNLNSEQVAIVKAAVQSLGGNYKYEPDPPHIHVGLPRGSGVTATAPADPQPTTAEEESA